MMQKTSRATLLASLVLAAACSSDEWERAAMEKSQPAASEAVASGDVAPHPARTAHAPAATADTTVTVYKSPSCGCCKAWVEHMREEGFAVVTIDTPDMNAVKHEHGVAADIGSCHTALAGGYVIEGHVPAADVRRLLTERPAIVGLAVPGMPMGSPGMEGPYSQKYDVVAFDRTVGRSVFASH